MAIRIDLTADPDTGTGVDFNADLIAHFNGYVPHQFPIFLPENANNSKQILHMSTPVSGAEEDTRIVLLEGSNFDYTFSNHSVSGTINTIRLGTFGAALNTSTGNLNTESGLITDMGDAITISNLSITNPVGVTGDVHEIVSGMMGGGPDGTDIDPQPIYDVIWSEGHDVYGSSGDDSYVGTSFADTARGAAGDDLLKGAKGADVLFGGAGADTLFGGNGADDLTGGNGKDELNGGAGNDELIGGNGNDILFGNNGGDTLVGGAGGDTLTGGNGADDLSGGNGADTLVGQAGKDVLDGGNGKDVLTGGNGADTFVFVNKAQADGDTVTDFKSGQNDILDLSSIDAIGGTGGNQAFEFIGSTGFSGTKGELRSWSSNGETLVAGDTDGDGNADFTINLTGTLTLLADDFLL